MFPARFTLSETEDGTRVVRVGRDLMSDRSTSKELLLAHPFRTMQKGLSAYIAGGFIQDCFPFLSADEREFIMTGTIAGEWDRLFPSVEEE